MYQVFTLEQKPHLRAQVERLTVECWPEFLRHGNEPHWHRLFDGFAAFQILFCAAGDEVIAVGHTIPLPWDNTFDDLPATIDQILVRAGERWQPNPQANTLSALAAMVRPSHRGQGLSAALLQQMKRLARPNGLTSLIAPVRPTAKALYPLTPFERYVTWTRADGQPFDPWIRTHQNLGARPLKVAPNALTVTGTIAEWEAWTGLSFPDSGDYVIPGALQPVRMDLAHNEGRYEESNFWMSYQV